MIEAAATLAEEIFSGTNRPHILATGREALRAEGEFVHRLAPLLFPTEGQNVKAAEALRFPAVQLFVERAAASLGSFELADAEASLVTDICRRLDGIRLAIEIAASRVDTFGVAGLAAGLNDRFQLLMQGRRTALPRHRTLSATLDWSYSQLSEVERLVLHRLATFVGAFTMEAAIGDLAQADIAAAEIVEAIANLVAKSLISADVDGAVPFYRLFDVTRTYALAKLEESGERNSIARRHAEYYRSALEKAQVDWETRPAAEWLQRHRQLIDNVRRRSIGHSRRPAMPRPASPLRSERCRSGSGCRLRASAPSASTKPWPDSSSRDVQSEMRLHATRAWSLMQTQGPYPQPAMPGHVFSNCRSSRETSTTSCEACGGFGPDFSTETSSGPRWSSPNGFRRWRRGIPAARMFWSESG